MPISITSSFSTVPQYTSSTSALSSRDALQNAPSRPIPQNTSVAPQRAMQSDLLALTAPAGSSVRGAQESSAPVQLVYQLGGRFTNDDSGRANAVGSSGVPEEEQGKERAIPTPLIDEASQVDEATTTEQGPESAQRADTSPSSGKEGPVNEGGDSQARERQRERVVQQQVAELAARDAEVRAHERAHQAVGGQYTGSVSYSYQTGPDGKRYAINGEVPIDVSPVPGDPRATIEKMRVVKAAATAPANPSPQDRNVAATATRILVQAQIDLAAQRLAEREGADTSEGRQRFAEAARSYEEIIGLQRRDIDVKELIDETV